MFSMMVACVFPYITPPTADHQHVMQIDIYILEHTLYIQQPPLPSILRGDKRRFFPFLFFS